jgi:hypothetical protein
VATKLGSERQRGVSDVSVPLSARPPSAYRVKLRPADACRPCKTSAEFRASGQVDKRETRSRHTVGSRFDTFNTRHRVER